MPYLEENRWNKVIVISGMESVGSYSSSVTSHFRNKIVEKWLNHELGMVIHYATIDKKNGFLKL